MSPQMRSAKKALKNKEFDTAVDLYEEHLELFPEDTTAKIEYGIANFLAGNEVESISIHNEIETEIDKTILDAQTQNLWNTYKSFIGTLCKGAAIASIVALPFVSGCSKPKNEKSVANSSGSTNVATPMDVNTSKKPPSVMDVSPGEKYGIKRPLPPQPDKPVEMKISTGSTNNNSAKPVNTKPVAPSPMNNTAKKPVSMKVKKPVVRPGRKYGIARPKYGIYRPKMRYGIRMKNKYPTP